MGRKMKFLGEPGGKRVGKYKSTVGRFGDYISSPFYFEELNILTEVNNIYILYVYIYIYIYNLSLYIQGFLIQVLV
jgi:hypothetical protein